MSVYRRGDVWWYKFRFAGQVIRESSKSESKTVAKDAERARRRELEGSFNCISKPRTAQLFSLATETWLKAKIAHLSPRSVIIERANLKHINPYFGKILLCDIVADDISHYQASRLEQGAAPKTVNLEVGTLRAILREILLLASIGNLMCGCCERGRNGRAISRARKHRLGSCRASRSRSLYPQSGCTNCMRYRSFGCSGGKIDFSRTLTVAADRIGDGRHLP